MAKPQETAVGEFQFVNAMRLNAAAVRVRGGLLLLALALTPAVWKRVERFRRRPDYRIPYDLSKDYWLYQRRLEDKVDSRGIVMLGDSVIWGDTFLADGTWSHFLGEQKRTAGQVSTAGVTAFFRWRSRAW